MAVSQNIGAGGLMFSLPQTREALQIGQLVELVFEPSLFGPANIQGEICHIVRKTIAGKPETCYGIKFIGMIQQLRRQLKEAPLLLTTIHWNDARTVDGLVEDINLCGLQIWAPQYIQPDSLLKLVFKDDGAQFDLAGICVYCHPVTADNDEMFTIGVCFRDLNKKEFEQLRAAIFNTKKYKSII